MKNRTAPIIAIIVLLLPILYGGSYLALVVPQGIVISMDHFEEDGRIVAEPFDIVHYRAARGLAPSLFWPLEQIDRRVRPGAWELQLYFR